jgi:hypothetical protein
MGNNMKTLKTTITITFENTLDLMEYKMEHPEGTLLDAMADLEEFILMDDIGHVAWAAENRLPSNMKLSYKFKWEDK